MSRRLLLVEGGQLFNHQLVRVVQLRSVSTVGDGLFEFICPLCFLLMQIVELIKHLHLLQAVFLRKVAELLGGI